MQTIGELLERNARCYPDKEALVFEDQRRTYRQLVDRTRRLADGLYRVGLRRQDRVAILATNCIEYMELLENLMLLLSDLFESVITLVVT